MLEGACGSSTDVCLVLSFATSGVHCQLSEETHAAFVTRHQSRNSNVKRTCVSACDFRSVHFYIVSISVYYCVTPYMLLC